MMMDKERMLLVYFFLSILLLAVVGWLPYIAQ